MIGFVIGSQSPVNTRLRAGGLAGWLENSVNRFLFYVCPRSLSGWFMAPYFQ